MDNLHRASELISRFMEGLASAEESAELERLIVEDPVVADTFAAVTRFDSMLLELFCNDRSGNPVAQPARM